VISLKDDPVRGAVQLIQLAWDNLGDDPETWHDSDHGVLLETYALLAELSESGLIQIAAPNFSPIGLVDQDCAAISQWIHLVKSQLVKAHSKLHILSLRARFRASLAAGFCYEFSQGDLERIQTLINQLRDLVAKSGEFEKDHQHRLLKRLENLQLEMHKRVSDLDRFWGLIGDAGVAIGKFGKDAKPFVDRIKEITDIVWRTQSRAEELPSGTSIPRLENREDEPDTHGD